MLIPDKDWNTALVSLCWQSTSFQAACNYMFKVINLFKVTNNNTSATSINAVLVSLLLNLNTFSILIFTFSLIWISPANIYLFKVSDRNTRKRCEIRSKLTVKTPKLRHWHRSGVFNVTFEHIPHLFLVFLSLNLNRKMLPCITYLAYASGLRFFLFLSFRFYV